MQGASYATGRAAEASQAPPPAGGRVAPEAVSWRVGDGRVAPEGRSALDGRGGGALEGRSQAERNHTESAGPRHAEAAGGARHGGSDAPGLEALTQQIEWLENTASSVLSVEEEHTAPSLHGAPSLQHVTLDTRDGHVGITVSNAAQGVRLDAVNECDIAFKAGLREGDVILAVNERAVDGHAEAIAMIDSAQPGPVAITFYSAQGGGGDDGSIGLEKHVGEG